MPGFGLGHAVWEFMAALSSLLRRPFSRRPQQLDPEEISLDEARAEAQERVRNALGPVRRWPR